MHDHQPLNHGYVLAHFSHLPASLVRTTISTKVNKKTLSSETTNNIPSLTGTYWQSCYPVCMLYYGQREKWYAVPKESGSWNFPNQLYTFPLKISTRHGLAHYTWSGWGYHSPISLHNHARPEVSPTKHVQLLSYIATWNIARVILHLAHCSGFFLLSETLHGIWR